MQCIKLRIICVHFIVIEIYQQSNCIENCEMGCNYLLFFKPAWCDRIHISGLQTISTFYERNNLLNLEVVDICHPRVDEEYV